MSPSREDSRALIRYALAGAAITVAIAWTLFLARDALLLIYVSAVVAIGLGPLVSLIQRRGAIGGASRLPRWLAILLIYFLLLGLLVGIGMLIVPPLIQQSRDLLAQLPDLLQRGQQYLIRRGLLGRALSVQEAMQRTPVGGTDAVGAVVGAAWGIVGGVFGLITILILVFYLLVDADNIVETFVRLFPRSERARVAEVCRRISGKVSAWLAGQLLLGTIIGATAAIGLGTMGVPYFYVLALIAGIGEMIPIVGPLLASVPAIAVALSVSPSLALGVAVFFIVQQQVENHVLVPKIMERQVGVSAVVLQVLFEEVAFESGER